MEWVAISFSSGEEDTLTNGEFLIKVSPLPKGNLYSVFIYSPMSLVSWTSLVAQMVKNLPAMWETWVQSLGWEDPLYKGVASLSSILARRIPWTEEPGRLQSIGS